jgi:anti-sigma regulatory factor (Ser/Thr protein kinase)
MTPMAPTRPIHPIRPPDPTNTAAAPGPSAANGTSVRVSRVVRLAPRLSAVAAARTEVEAAICAWCVPVDPDVAILLTSELVTNAVTHATAGASRNRKAARRGFAAEAVLLVIAVDDAGLRVDVHDGSVDLPVLGDCPAEADAETGRGLLLVTSLSAEWGFYRTPGGKAVYFTLQAQADVHGNVIDGPDGHDPRSVS